METTEESYHKRYYKMNRDKILQSTKERLSHPEEQEKLKVYRKEYYMKNKERLSQKYKKYSTENREKINKRNRQLYREKNKAASTKQKKVSTVDEITTPPLRASDLPDWTMICKRGDFTLSFD